MTSSIPPKPGPTKMRLLANMCRICLEQHDDVILSDLKVITLKDQLSFSAITSHKLLLHPVWPYNICSACKSNLEKVTEFCEAVIYTQTNLNRFLTTSGNHLKYQRQLEVIRKFNRNQEGNVEESIVSEPDAQTTDLVNSSVTEDIVELEIESAGDESMNSVAKKIDKKPKRRRVVGRKIPLKRCKIQAGPRKSVQSKVNCPYCSRPNATPYHVMMHESGPVPCDREGCDKVCTDQIAFLRHKYMHNASDNQAACEICGKMVMIKIMRKHLNSHRPLADRQKTSTHNCETCGKVFTTAAHLRVHNTQVHVRNREHQCEFCEMAFLFPYELRWHRVKKHEDKLPESERPNMRCNCCNRLFLSQGALKCHLTFKETGNGVNCGAKGKRGPNSNQRKKIKTLRNREDNTWSCDFCDVKFETRGEVASHRRTHSIICDICNRSYFSKTLFEKHVKSHTNENYDRPYKCRMDGCKARFRKPYMLQIHTRFHTRERPYKCQKCPAGFTSSSDLMKHKRTAHNEKNIDVVHRTGMDTYSCPECPAKFQLKSQQSVHIRQKHTKNILYDCPQCNKSFASSFSMRYHFARCPQRIIAKEDPALDLIEEVDDSMMEVTANEIVIENYDDNNVIEIGFDAEYLDEEMLSP